MERNYENPTISTRENKMILNDHCSRKIVLKIHIAWFKSAQAVFHTYTANHKVILGLITKGSLIFE